MWLSALIYRVIFILVVGASWYEIFELHAWSIYRLGAAGAVFGLLTNSLLISAGIDGVE